nr:MAG TPA: hypothetical protein [Caudoviricetes sp.]
MLIMYSILKFFHWNIIKFISFYRIFPLFY